jgi:glutathione S-transferase
MWSQTPPSGAFAITSPDARAARLAAGQWSVLTLNDLRACGLSYREVQGRVARGVLHPLYKGVYAWGHHNIPTEGRFLAAVLACGPYAVLSHYSAAALRCLVRWDGRPFEITAPGKHAHPRVKAHRSNDIERMIVKAFRSRRSCGR